MILLVKYVLKPKYRKEGFEGIEGTIQPVIASTVVVPVTIPANLNLKLLTKEEFSDRVKMSDYFNSMSPVDLTARATEDIIFSGGEHYKNVYLSSYVDMTEAEKNVLFKAIEQANELTSSYKNLQLLEWKVVKVINDIEYGMPHTMVDMIVVNEDVLQKSENEIVKTLIHEKLHVYQRLNNNSTQKWVNKVGFSTLLPSEFSSLDKDLLELRRSNPDLDKNTYKHNKSNVVLKQLYNSSNPTSLQDSKAIGILLNGNHKPMPLTNGLLGLPKSTYCQLEHPFEIMACLMSEMITSPAFVADNMSNQVVRSSLDWMREELGVKST
jgi:hypothetical protein